MADPTDTSATGGYPPGSTLTGGAPNTNTTLTGGAPNTNTTGGAGTGGGDVSQLNYQALLDQATAEITTYSQQLPALYQQVQKAQSDFASAQQSGDPTQISAAQRNLDSLNASYVSALNNLSRAYDNRIAVATKAMDNRWMQPGQTQVWQAQAANDNAQATKTTAEAQTIQATAGATQQQLMAQAASEQAQARLDDAQGQAVAAKTPAEIQQLQSNANLAQAQADQAKQATSAANAKLPAEVQAGQASADALVAAAEKAVRENRQAPTDSQAAASNQATVQQQQAAAQIAIRQAQNMPTPEQASRQTEANIGSTQAGTALTQAQAGNTAMGPLFLLPDKLQAIQNAVTQLGQMAKSGQIPADHGSLDNLLNQYVAATVGGTTVSGASDQARQALQDIYQQGVQQRQQNTSLEQTLATAGSNMMGSIVPSLIGEVKNLPAGSNALAGAVQDIYGLAGNYAKQFAPPPQVAAPNLPPFLASFAGQQGAPNGPTALPGTTAPTSTVSAPKTTTISPDGTVTIQHQADTNTGVVPSSPLNFSGYQGAPSPQGFSGMGGTSGLPPMLSGMAPPDVGFVNQLWGRAA